MESRWEGLTMFVHEFTKAGHLTRVTVTHDTAGWELREERDDQEVRRLRFTDWHRVERTLRTIEIEAAA
jgi:hypothetical protein